MRSYIYAKGWRVETIAVGCQPLELWWGANREQCRLSYDEIYKNLEYIKESGVYFHRKYFLLLRIIRYLYTSLTFT